MGLLRFIFIVLLIYFLIRVLLRYVFPFLAMYFLKRKVNQAKNPKNSKEKSTISKKEELGDYIDYEEIKDEE